MISQVSHTRGNMYKLQKCSYVPVWQKIFFTETVVNLWNSFPSLVVVALSLNCFKMWLDKSNHFKSKDFKVPFLGIESRSYSYCRIIYYVMYNYLGIEAIGPCAHSSDMIWYENDNPEDVIWRRQFSFMNSICQVHGTWLTYVWLTNVLLSIQIPHKNTNIQKIINNKYLNRFTTTVLPQPFYGPFSETTQVSRCQKRNLWTLWCKGRLTEADTPTIRLGATPSELTSVQCPPPPSSPCFLQAGCPSCRPTNSVKALKATSAFGLGRRR